MRQQRTRQMPHRTDARAAERDPLALPRSGDEGGQVGRREIALDHQHLRRGHHLRDRGEGGDVVEGQGRPRCTSGRTTKPKLSNTSVVPSGGDDAATTAPTAPPAPGQFSTTTGTPRCSAILACGRRITVSDCPPGAKGTITRTGRGWAAARPARQRR
jgi:hypothetical protein